MEGPKLEDTKSSAIIYQDYIEFIHRIGVRGRIMIRIKKRAGLFFKKYINIKIIIAVGMFSIVFGCTHFFKF